MVEVLILDRTKMIGYTSFGSYRKRKPHVHLSNEFFPSFFSSSITFTGHRHQIYIQNGAFFLKAHSEPFKILTTWNIVIHQKDIKNGMYLVRKNL